MVAVDAGTLLSAIDDILAETPIKLGAVAYGPFKDLRVPHESSRANSVHMFKNIIGRVLLTHAHLDHISGLAINTPILDSRDNPKPVAGLPYVVDALKAHLFNGLIWPNLTNEDNGIGLIKLERVKDSGRPIPISVDSSEYTPACKGLLTRCFGLSHGQRPPSHLESSGFTAQ